MLKLELCGKTETTPDGKPCVLLAGHDTVLIGSRCLSAEDNKLLPVDWEKQTGITIMNADGWHRGVKDYPGAQDWDKPITRHEFHARATVSTCLFDDEKDAPSIRKIMNGKPE